MIWILNKRPSPQVWADSVLHWYSVTRRLFHSFGLNYYSTTNGLDPAVVIPRVSRQKMTEASLQADMTRGLERSRSRVEHERRRRLLMEVYTNHTRKVQSFCQQYDILEF